MTLRKVITSTMWRPVRVIGGVGVLGSDFISKRSGILGFFEFLNFEISFLTKQLARIWPLNKTQAMLDIAQIS